MPNYVRWREPGATYFFTVNTHLRRRLFDDSVARRILQRSLTEVRKEWPFDMLACVLIPDHLHCIWALPPGDDNFPARWANVKRLFTQRFLAAGGKGTPVTDSRRRRHERSVWQPRYWEHLIRDEDEMIGYRDYIHLNPVKHGLVREPEDWPWSSVHRHLKLGWLDPNWTAWTPIDVPDGGEWPEA